MQTLILAAFFLSGLAGLMHQVVWAKLLVQLIGAAAYAQAVVLAVFMGGLSLGALVLGRWVDRHGRPLRTYVLLEVGIAAYALLLPLLVSFAGRGYVMAASLAFDSPGLTLALRFALALVIVFPPALAMGGTLPVLARHLVKERGQTRRWVAALYAFNSLGAVMGAGVAGFLTLPLFGIYISLGLASLLNGIAGLLLLERARSEGVEPVAEPTTPVRHDPSHGEVMRTRATLIALGLSGFAAMGYEVLFVRIISLAFGSSTYSFSVMLMAFIFGISVGSALIAKRRIRDPLWWLGASQLGVVAALLAATPLLARLPYWIALLRVDLVDDAFGFELYQLGKAALCLGVLLVPTIFMGFAFPLVAHVQARRDSTVGSEVGATYACNTLGNVLGVLGTSLLLLPGLGLLGAFHFNLALNGLAGLIVLAVAGGVTRASRLGVVGGVAAILAVYLVWGLGWPLPLRQSANHLRLRTMSAEEARVANFGIWHERFVMLEDQLAIFYRAEDPHANVMVTGDAERTSLYVNTKPDASTHGDLATQLLLAHAPLFLKPDAKRMLVIGLGSGITAGSGLRHPLERADIVEISEAVVSADTWFSNYNYQVLSDPRVQLFIDDGQSFLRTTPHRYDVVISEPSNPWIAGIGGLFTLEFFEAVRSRLNPGGVFTLWFHSYEMSDESVDLVFRTLGEAFPYVMIFREAGFADVVAVASSEPLEPDFAAMEARFDEPAIRNDLARVGATNLASWLAHHGLSSEAFRKVLGPGPLNRFARERLEYRAPRSLFLDERSSFLAKFDAFLQPGALEGALLQRYAMYRATAGEPVSRNELAEAARYVGSFGSRAQALSRKLAELAARAPELARPALRPARGASLPLEQLGAFELRLRAERARGEGHDGQALSLYRRALELHPDDARTALRISELLREEGRKRERIEFMRERVDQDPHNLLFLHDLAWAYLDMGAHEEARATLQRILEDREHSGSLAILAALWVQEDEPERAIPLFERALAARPAFWQAAVDLAQVLQKTDPERARRVIDKALKLNPDRPELLKLRQRLR